MSRAIAGDRSAFSVLVERHSGPVWTAVARTLADRETAREIFQETWLRAFESLPGLRERDRLRSWLLSIALNLTREWLRRSGLRPLAAAGQGQDQAPELEPDAERRSGEHDPVPAGLERGELHSALIQALASLPPRQREVVQLRIHFEASYSRIARELAISEETARANFYQGMRRLRARFVGEELP